MKLEDIGFYTLSDYRAEHTSIFSPLWRCELILTDRCNFKCPYCRGLRSDCLGDMDMETANRVLDYWIAGGLKNVRFSGGEPTLYAGLEELVRKCANNNVERIAVSTNGSMSIKRYMRLYSAGVNDFSISLDGCCAMVGDRMSGTEGAWKKVVENIRELSKITYVSVGMVFTEDNIDECIESVLFADLLGVSDIRVIPSAQYNLALRKLSKLPNDILNKYPILKYRVNNIKDCLHVRGIPDDNTDRCWLAIDDMAIAGRWHFPCIIYLREGGNPIGEIGPNMRQERLEWIEKHRPWKDKICKNNCLDICIDYNRKANDAKEDVLSHICENA